MDRYDGQGNRWRFNSTTQQWEPVESVTDIRVARAAPALLAALEAALEDLGLWVEEHGRPCDCATCTHTIPAVKAAIAKTKEG